MIRLLFFLSSFVWLVISTCPSLPHGCLCRKEITGGLGIFCNSIEIPFIFKALGKISVDRLWISHCSSKNLTEFPLRGVRSIGITNCEIQHVNDSVLKVWAASLEELILSDNLFSEVPMFPQMPKLVSLNMTGNKISNLSENSFHGLRSLRYLRLKDNEICRMSRSPIFGVHSILELLDLSGNCLDAFPTALQSSVALKYLDLSNNIITEVRKGDLRNLPQLLELRLNNNGVSSIDAAAFGNVSSLRFLYIRDNLLSKVNNSLLQSFPRLEVLDVSNNLLLKAPCLRNMHTMQQVKLDGNLIENIVSGCFSNDPNLKLISIQNNRIKNLAVNSFQNLENITILLLGNNTIASIGVDTFKGMHVLEKLNLRNNSIASIDGVRLPTSISSLDLSQNNLEHILAGTFANMTKLFWLDLSNNMLRRFDEGAFTNKIDNILLHGNRLECDDKFNWFLNYLVTYRVRTFLVAQNEVMCAGPSQYAGVRLKDLIIRKANDTISEGIRTLGLDQSNQRSLISSFIPGLSTMQGAASAPTLGNLASTIPILGTITQAIPSLRSLPGLSGSSNSGLAVPVSGGDKNLNNAIEQFTAPLVRFATGGQPVASDIRALIESIPNFVVNVPGFGDIDISKVNPEIIEHVLSGREVLAISKENLDKVIHKVMDNMYTAAVAAQNGKLTEEQAKFLPPVDKLPMSLIGRVLQGDSLPGLNSNKTKAILDYYKSAMGIGKPVPADSKVILSDDMLELLKILPPDYNITRIPSDVIAAVARGDVPDMSKLPYDLLEYFKANTDKIAEFLGKTKANFTIEDVMSRLPKFEKPVLPTFSPYDINRLSSDIIHEEEAAKRSSQMRLYTVVSLGFVGVVTIAILVSLAMHIKRQQKTKSSLNGSASAAGSSTESTATAPSEQFPPPVANSTIRSTRENNVNAAE